MADDDKEFDGLDDDVALMLLPLLLGLLLVLFTVDKPRKELKKKVMISQISEGT